MWGGGAGEGRGARDGAGRGGSGKLSAPGRTWDLRPLMPQLQALSLQSAREPSYKVPSSFCEFLKRCSFPKDLLNNSIF